MPFVNARQARACFAKQNRAAKRGRKSKWNCREWARKTPKRIMAGRQGRMKGSHRI